MNQKNKKSENRRLAKDWLDDQQRRYNFFRDPLKQQVVVAPKACEFPECFLASNL